MRMNGCIHLYRREVEREKILTDAELRLYYLYRRLADWDTRHTETFGTVKISIRELRKLYLPSSRWSIGKISATINGLITKEFLERLTTGRILIRYFGIFQAPIRQGEPLLRLLEQGVPVDEQSVSRPEQPDREALRLQRQNLSKKLSFP